jgi:hypothetical protein
MKLHSKFICCVLPLALLCGCKKEPATSEPTASTAAKPAPAAPTPTPSTAPDASSQGAETTSKMAVAAWAMKQDEIKHDPKGQWAIQATSSSSYNDAQGTSQWSANQATGVPNVDNYGDNGNARAPKTPDGGIEWLDLKFPKPVYAEEVRIRKSCGSGAIIKVEVFDEQGAAHTLWAGNDPTTELNYLILKTPKTAFKTERVKITLATNVIPGWNEIGAVQLVGE